MLVTLSGIVTFVNSRQFSNAIDSILVTLFGIVTLVNPQLENDPTPIVVIVLGIITFDSPQHPQNVSNPITVKGVSYVPIPIST